MVDAPRGPVPVHTDYQDFPATLLRQDKFVAITSAHEIAHKLGQADHVTNANTRDVTGTQDANAVYLMFTPLSINPDIVRRRGLDKRYPCRLRREDWNNVNYVYPTTR
jgi:hypothetical protein